MHIDGNIMQKPTHLITKKITQALLISGVILISNSSFAYDEAPNSAAKSETELVQPVMNSEDTQQAEKIKARVAEVNAEIQATAKAANIEKNGYYVERKSYGTGRETEPPRYVKQLNKTWLGEYDALADVDWLDVGLEYRFRYESRDNDFRRNNQTIDDPILLRTRAFIAVKNKFDPFRFTLELQYFG